MISVRKAEDFDELTHIVQAGKVNRQAKSIAGNWIRVKQSQPRQSVSIMGDLHCLTAIQHATKSPLSCAKTCKEIDCEGICHHRHIVWNMSLTS